MTQQTTSKSPHIYSLFTIWYSFGPTWSLTGYTVIPIVTLLRDWVIPVIFNFVSRPYDRAYASVMSVCRRRLRRLSVRKECIVAKRCVIEKTIDSKSRIWEIDWHQNEWLWLLFEVLLWSCQPLCRSCGVSLCERLAGVLGHYGGHTRPQVADRGMPSRSGTRG